jgi:carbonic anhydrase
MYRHSKENQRNVTPLVAFQYLVEGNDRFVHNLRANRDHLQLVNQTRDGQYPFATILSCMDSRTAAELIFDQGLGDIFSIRIAGNVLNEDILGSMEYATQVVGTKIIVVLGHTKCGAIIGACDGVQMGNLTQLLSKIQPAVDQAKQEVDEADTTNYVNKVASLNVEMTIQQIKERSPIIADFVEKGTIDIVGGLYDVDTGKVTFFKVNSPVEA